MSDPKILVKLAREAIVTYLKSGTRIEPSDNIPSSFLEKGGIFCTLNTYPEHKLRGCIGRPYPEFSLVNALIDSAIDAATQDPRFPAVNEEELDNLTIEITILTPPTLIKEKQPKGYLKEIKIGRDGLLIEQGFRRGLLLPQVPVEWGWDIEEFLVHLCHKAGLPANAWKKPETNIYRFEGEIWREISPNGKIEC